MKIIPLKIKGLGYPQGRDAIFLDEEIGKGSSTLTLIGEFAGILCTELNKRVWISYEITFHNVLKTEVTDLDDHYDFYKNEEKEDEEENPEYSSFEQIENSNFLKESNSKNHHHFVFHTL